MRVLHVSQPVDGGTAVVVRELARAGVADGDDVIVASPRGGYLGDWVRAAGADWVAVPMTRGPSLADVRAVRSVRRLAAAADVVHLHSSKAGAVGRLAVATLGPSRPPVVFTPHGWSFYTGGRAAPLYRGVERALGGLTDVVTVVSDTEARDGRAALGPGTRIEVVPNGVDVAAFAPDGPAAAHGPGPLVVQVGRLSRQKGQDRSLRALALLPPDVRLRLVGDGPEHAELVALAARLGVGERVEFAGSVDPRPHLRAADVAVLPSRWEGMSLVLLETMALGRAVVATTTGGIEALGDDAGVVIANDEPSAPGALADAIGALLGDAGRREGLGRRARERAVANHGITRTVAQYRALWDELGKRPGRARYRGGERGRNA